MHVVHFILSLCTMHPIMQRACSYMMCCCTQHGMHAHNVYRHALDMHTRCICNCSSFAKTAILLYLHVQSRCRAMLQHEDFSKLGELSMPKHRCQDSLRAVRKHITYQLAADTSWCRKAYQLRAAARFRGFLLYIIPPKHSCPSLPRATYLPCRNSSYGLPRSCGDRLGCDLLHS
jgi:hypothetical protein